MDIFRNLAHDIGTKLPGLEVLEEEHMSTYTSFKIGGPAAVLVIPKSPQELKALLELLYDAGISPLILGNGTNLLVTDEPLRRIVVKLGEGIAGIELLDETTILAQAGAPLSKVAAFAWSQGLGGLEFAHGIPGTVGGAVMMNAGAYDGEIKNVVSESAYLLPDGTDGVLSGDEQAFSYRRSAYSDSDKIITSARFELRRDNPAKIIEKMNEFAQKRRDSQPLDKPSAGSAFKRPPGGYAAALIDEAGLRGYSVGGAQVSPKHAGFIVNNGSATFNDVISLIEYVKEQVFAHSGVMLDPEIKIIQNR